MLHSPRIPIHLKTPYQIKQIHRAYDLLHKFFEKLSFSIAPGISGKDIEDMAQSFFTPYGAKLVLEGYNGFPGKICVSINSVAAHGIPNATPMERGEVFTVDLVIEYQSWLADGSWTYSISPIPEAMENIISGAWKATMAGISACQEGSRIYTIGKAIEAEARRNSLFIIPEFSGHGIGRSIHELPHIISFASDSFSSNSQSLERGMVFTIEPILCDDDPAISIMEDQQAYRLKNGGITAQFEHTVAITNEGPIVLSLPNYQGPNSRIPF